MRQEKHHGISEAHRKAPQEITEEVTEEATLTRACLSESRGTPERANGQIRRSPDVRRSRRVGGGRALPHAVMPVPTTTWCTRPQAHLITGAGPAAVPEAEERGWGWANGVAFDGR
jgi:hypothetical protein